MAITLTDAEILRIGYLILEADTDVEFTKEEWNRFETLRFDAEEDAFLEAEDEFYDDQPTYDQSIDIRTRLFNIAQS